MTVPEHLDWMTWRPIIARVATLEEIERHWSLSDLLDAHDALDVRAGLDQEADARAREEWSK